MELGDKFEAWLRRDIKNVTLKNIIFWVVYWHAVVYAVSQFDAFVNCTCDCGWDVMFQAANHTNLSLNFSGS